MFEERLGDYVEVGFRLCEGNDEWESRKCFRKGDYEVLVIGYREKGAASLVEQRLLRNLQPSSRVPSF